LLIISWNMGCGPRSRYRRSHADAWHYLLALRPDVAFVQEALLQAAPSPTVGSTVWSAKRGTESGTAIFVRADVTAEPVAVRSSGSYIAAAIIRSAGVPLFLASVHVGPGNYKENRRVLTRKLIKVTTGRRFVVGGDLNAARHWDEVYGGRTHMQFFETLKNHGFHDCHYAQHGKEIQSFWGHQAREAYQCDHLLTDATTGAQTVSCAVIDNPEVRALSDHGPLRLELAIDLDSNGR
jgi:exonuclease III